MRHAAGVRRREAGVTGSGGGGGADAVGGRSMAVAIEASRDRGGGAPQPNVPLQRIGVIVWWAYAHNPKVRRERGGRGGGEGERGSNGRTGEPDIDIVIVWWASTGERRNPKNPGERQLEGM